ncbi:GL20112 [Drosophila persimilis]|uniref:GL20112 n=1 Tax=Drosophila persimilis TaxID=7234 RepID=B4H674_DROPE|nr:uncharacterized protein LOC6601281 [Drosophila persimilis]EDW33298.1 GL20112 [Drosophila persimilis]
MSSLTNGTYFAKILCPTGKKTILGSFTRPVMKNIFDTAAQIGIVGRYLVSAEDNTVIGDDLALRYLLERNHRIIVSDSLDCRRAEKVSLDSSGETATEEEGLHLVRAEVVDQEFTNTERELLQELLEEVTRQVVVGFRKFLTEQSFSKAPTE